MSNLKTVLSSIGRGARRLLLLLITILFTLAATVTLAWWIISLALLNPHTYHEAIAETSLAERTPAVVADVLAAYSRQVETIPNASHQTWQAAAETLLTPSWVEEHLHSNVDTLFQWLNADDVAVPSLAFDLSPIGQTLRSEEGALVILPLLEDRPPCTPEEEAVISLSEGSLVSCLPHRQDVTGLAQLVAVELADALPPRLSLAQAYESGQQSPESLQILQKVHAGKRAVEAFGAFGLRLTLLLISLYALLNSTSLQNLLRALPRPLFAAAGLSFLLWIAIHGYVAFGLPLTIARGVRSSLVLGSESQAIIVEAAQLLLGRVRWPWLGVIAAVAVAGFVFHLAAIGLARRAAGKAEESTARTSPRRRIRRQFR